MKLEIGDVVHIIGAADKRGYSCIAVGTVTEIGEEKVVLEKIALFPPKGFRIYSNNLEGFDPNKHSEYSGDRLSKVSETEPLYSIYKKSFLLSQ